MGMLDVEPPARAAWVIDQAWEGYNQEHHALWHLLFARQAQILRNRAAPEFLAGLSGSGIAADGIPHFGRLSDTLERATGWRIVAVPGLVPTDAFFEHLANRRFPATNFIRGRDQLDYLTEPDVFTTSTGMSRCYLTPSLPITCRPVARAS